MRSAGMPAAIMSRIIGCRNRWFGTGRVISQIRMQALDLPLASSRNGGAPIGLSRASRMAAVESATIGSWVLRITVGLTPSGRSSFRVDFP
jgi:hypothetical protein